MTDERLDWHLWNWSNWQRTGRGVGRSYPSRSAGFRGARSDFDADVAQADMRCAQAVEAVLRGCTAAERAAVHHVHLEAVYLLRDLSRAYNSARAKLAHGLTARGIV